MVSKRRPTEASLTYKLDSRPYSAMVKQACGMADKALQRYGEPRISLAELRQTLDGQLRGVSLGEWITRERQAGW